MIIKKFEGSCLGADEYWNSRKLLVRSVGLLGGREIKAYVEDFLESTTSWLKFAVDEEEDSETEEEEDLDTEGDAEP